MRLLKIQTILIFRKKINHDSITKNQNKKANINENANKNVAETKEVMNKSETKQVDPAKPLDKENVINIEVDRILDHLDPSINSADKKAKEGAKNNTSTPISLTIAKTHKKHNSVAPQIKEKARFDEAKLLKGDESEYAKLSKKQEATAKILK